MKRALLERTIAVVREVVGSWRPVAGTDDVGEFDREVRAIARQLRRITSARDAAAAVARVFSASLHDARFTADACDEVGRRLFDRLRAAGLVS